MPRTPTPKPQAGISTS